MAERSSEVDLEGPGELDSRSAGAVTSTPACLCTLKISAALQELGNFWVLTLF